MTRQGGFTLLEMLAVISLLGLLLALAGGLLASANRVVATAQGVAARVDEVRAAQRYLRQALSQALPLAAGPVVAAPARFVGEADHMVFHGPLPASLGGGVFQQRVAREGDRLLASFARLDGQATEVFGAPQVLLQGVRELHFSYHGHAPLGQDTGWLPAWPWPARLPAAVRIEATLAGAVPWVAEQVNLRLDLASEAGKP